MELGVARFFLEDADVDATAADGGDPAEVLELLIGGADGVGVELKPFGESTGAGETFAGDQLTAGNGEDELGDELISD